MADPRVQLIQVLQEAASQHPERLKVAEQQLKRWEIEREFYATLQDIFYDRSLDHGIRWISGIYLKNSIEKYWRRTARNAISPEEKALIRRRLLTTFDEERKELAVTNAVLTSKIARLDFPQDWPDLLQNLLSIIQSTVAVTEADARSRLIQFRALYTLHMVVKALCSQRLAPSRRHLEQVSPELFRQIATIYVGHVDRFLAALHQPSSFDSVLVIAQMEVSIVCLKCVRRLMVHGFEHFEKAEETRQFFALTFVHLQRFYSLRSAFPDPTAPVPVALNSHIIKLGKFYIDLQKNHPLPFVLAPGATDVVKFYWGVLVEEGERVGARRVTEQLLNPPPFERFLVQGLLLLKNTIKNFAYTIEKGASPEEASTVSQARQVIDQNLLTPAFVNSCAEVLVSRYMVLRPEDLKLWEEDPEAFVGGEEADHWEYELRPCAEKVFMELLSQYRVQLSPILLNLLENVATVSDHAGLMFKDAVYCAVGLGAHDLFDSLDFDVFLVKRLSQEAWNREPNLKIIRRRIAWLIGKWVGVKIGKPARPDVYRVMLHLMYPDEDMVVRLTAVNNLKNCVDEWDFEPGPFAPFLEEAVRGTTRMLSDVEESESRMRILNSLSMIIERVKEQIAPYTQQIIDLLPSLWNASESEHLFKSAILAALTKLVGSLKEQSSNLQDFVVPLIRHSVDHNQVAYLIASFLIPKFQTLLTSNPFLHQFQETHLYLMEDGLDLWLTTLQSATQCSEQLFGLMPVAITLLEYGTENLKRLLKILESYMLLAPEVVIQVGVAGIGCALHAAEAFLTLYSGLCILELRHLNYGRLRPPPRQSQAAGLQRHRSRYRYRAAGGAAARLGGSDGKHRAAVETANRRDGEAETFVLTQYLGLFARIVIYDPAFFIEFIEVASQRCDPSQPNLMSLVLETWFDKFDNIGHPRQRKLNCMALTALVATANPFTLERLAQVMAVWSDVLSEVKESGGGDTLVYWEEAPDIEDAIQIEGTSESKRKLELLQRDPIHTTNLLGYIHAKLKVVEALCGGPDTFQRQYLAKVDPALLDQLNTLLTA
ncbi:armadillo-type protein [Endogone sp. FLAS-F59071]|nr:armadillo-type protein [Endogone sp. FLAS-F59071]|eukprot:RUS22823.1 armadillo-type protein [Endogone sp. FLAS-F59071]